MPAKFNASQFKSKMRQAASQAEGKMKRALDDYERDVKRAVGNYNSAVNNYNRAVRQHNATVLQNRSRMQSALRQLQHTSSVTTTYRQSVSVLHSAYQNVAITYDASEPGTRFEEYVYSGIEQENANSLQTAIAVSGDAISDEQTYSLRETAIIDQLALVSNDLDNRWRGALYALNPANPDAARQFCTSTREIFTEIFDAKAKDKDVFAILPNCEKTERGNASCRSKIKFFLHRKGMISQSVEDFIEKDMDNILELFHVLSAGTHGAAGRYNFQQLSAIKKRVEDGLVFLCEIAA
jgi:hypothetical protein